MLLIALSRIKYLNDDIVFVNADSDNVTFFSDDVGLVNEDLNKFSLDGVNFGDDDLETIICVRLMAWFNRYKQRKNVKKEIRKELMPVVWYLTKWWDLCMSEDEKKKCNHFWLIKVV